MALITPDRLVALKAKVKAECQRRNVSSKGSVSSYGGTDYDYSVVPASGKRILKEHYEKNAAPMNAILGNIDTNGARIVDADEITTMETEIVRLAQISRTASDSGCAESCTGLCSTGCVDSCYGGCDGDCGGCDDSCYARCEDNCSGGCSDRCTGCTATCADDCTNYCEIEDLCGGYCIAVCMESCTNNNA